MTIWIKRSARILAIGAFFVVFFLGIDTNDPFDINMLVIAFLKGMAGALLFWAAGFVFADIIIKGMVADVHTELGDAIEGGVLQRLYDVQLSQAPEVQCSEKVTVSSGAKSKSKAT